MYIVVCPHIGDPLAYHIESLLQHTYEMYQQHKQPIICSGLGVHQPSSAWYAQQYLQKKGVASKHIIQEPYALDVIGSAFFTYPMAKDGYHHIITSKPYAQKTELVFRFMWYNKPIQVVGVPIIGKDEQWHFEQQQQDLQRIAEHKYMWQSFKTRQDWQAYILAHPLYQGQTMQLKVRRA
ncbi:MAG: YdcF family protein [Candidatus Woesearchaeota archaeon]